PKPAPPHKPKLLFRDTRSFVEVLTSTKPQVVCDERRLIQYDSIDEDKEWLRRSLVGKILLNADVATMKEMVLKSIEKAVSFIFLGASQVIVTFKDQLASLKEQDNARSILYSLLGNLRQWEARICAYDTLAWYPCLGYRWKVRIGIALMPSCRVGETLLAMTRHVLARDPYRV
ncbi:hypothetical protein NC653_017979, partial [Populus alba x Populus x berolinensis]